jgi:hypothetical protein
MVKHKKTIKRQRNLRKQIGKGGCFSTPSENNSTQMTLHVVGNALVDQIHQTITTCNTVLDDITQINKKDQLNKVKNLLAIVMQLIKIPVIKNDSEKYHIIIGELKLINRRIKGLLTESSV